MSSAVSGTLDMVVEAFEAVAGAFKKSDAQTSNEKVMKDGEDKL